MPCKWLDKRFKMNQWQTFVRDKTDRHRALIVPAVKDARKGNVSLDREPEIEQIGALERWNNFF